MAWAAVAAWVVALVFAAVILSFCAYEIVWKMRRLQRDAERLRGLSADAQRLQLEVAAVQERVAAVQRLARPNGG